MPSITESAKAKINLTLHVQGRRSDGYHELNSFVAFADIADHLEITSASENSLQCDGPFGANLTGTDNIIWKAWSHLTAIMPVPKVRVHLTKNLPLASGIGGGSADAAAMLRGLLRLTKSSLNAEQVAGLAFIGADVPVCFRGEACMMQGIGEKFESPSGIKIPPALVLVNPLAPCSTAEVFKTLGIKPGQDRPITKEFWRNDLTQAALKVQPVIADVLKALRQTNLQNVNMSGSGATCFGLAQSREEAELAQRDLQVRHPHWWVKAGTLN